MIEQLNPVLKDFRFVLASKSPRRQQLLREFGLQFDVDVRPVEETFPSNLTARRAAEHVAGLKADAFQTEELDAGVMIITADTVVASNDDILGKPGDESHARQMLQNLSGRSHRVVTAVNLKTRNRQQLFSVETQVFFKELLPKEIDYYISNFKPFDKAGAYGIQEWIGFAAIERINGSYFNVVGLPVHALYQKLLEWE